MGSTGTSYTLGMIQVGLGVRRDIGTDDGASAWWDCSCCLGQRLCMQKPLLVIQDNHSNVVNNTKADSSLFQLPFSFY